MDKFKHQFSTIISGPSGCGKSHFVADFIRHLDTMFGVKFDKKNHLLVKRGECWKKKRQLLVQKEGAFLPLLLTPLISGVLGSLFNK
uniref:Uncharacterized protein n=1 Tax=Timema poppense TaxID=170557 RepID=A0A7R9DUK8_TIMPO|nr:unnamed protein product [Timema poppensis]